MDPRKELTENSRCLPYWAVNLHKACLAAKSLHAQREEIAQYEHSKKMIRDRDLKFDQCPRVMKKIRAEIAEKEAAAKDTKAELKSRGKKVAKEINKMLDSAADIKSVLRSQGIPTFAATDSLFFDSKHYTDQVDDLKTNIDTLESQKLDKADHEDTMRNLIKKTEKDLRKLLEDSETVVKSELQSINADLEENGEQLLRITSDESLNLMTERIFRRMLGLEGEKPMTIEDVPIYVQNCVRDHLKETFLKQLLNTNQPTSTIYPPKIDNNVRSLQARDTNELRTRTQDVGQSNRIKKSFYKILKMNKESDEALSLFEANLNSWPVQNVLKNLDHIDRVTRSHKELLDFMNAPAGCSNTPLRHTFLDEDNTVKNNELENIPPQISLFMDKRLSNALATSLAEYTNKLYFSDLTQRLEELEKKLQ